MTYETRQRAEDTPTPPASQNESPADSSPQSSSRSQIPGPAQSVPDESSWQPLRHAAPARSSPIPPRPQSAAAISTPMGAPACASAQNRTEAPLLYQAFRDPRS